MKIPKICPELAEETGLHMGDGSMNYYRGKGLYQLRGHKTDDREHYEKRISYLYNYLYGEDIKLRDMGDVFGFQIWSDELVAFKIGIGIPYGKKEELRIPSCFFESDELMRSFIRGIFDTDGCVYFERKNNGLYPRVEITTTSALLASDLEFVLSIIGFRVSCYSTGRKETGWKPICKIVLRGWIMLDKWFNEIKPMNPKHVKRYKKGLVVGWKK